MEHPVSSRWSGPREIPSGDLLRECGQKLTDKTLWAMFQERFQRHLFIYLFRALRFHSKRDDVQELVSDLAQDVYVRLVQNNGNLLRGFRGETDLSVQSFLGRVCSSVVADHLRRDGNLKRSGDNIVSIEEAREMIETSRREHDELDVVSILSWIDIDRMMAADSDRKHSQRNALIFKLHYIDGLSADEIACYPGFDLSESGVEAVLVRLRKRIRK